MITPGCRIDLISCVFRMGISILLVLPLSCEKSEGLGGTGSISGTIYEHFYNDDFSLLIHEKPAVDEDVFIVFGNSEELGARVRTNDLGQFSFKYLYPGDYRVFFLSEDSASFLDLDEEKVYQVALDRGEEQDLGTLEKLTTLDFDDGSATIRGVVRVIDYVDLSTWPDLVVDKIYYATEQEVYLTYHKHTFYDERIRTQTGGVFEFRGLIPGNYLIFLYSDDVTGESDKVSLEFEVSIEDPLQVIDLGEITIEKL